MVKVKLVWPTVLNPDCWVFIHRRREMRGDKEKGGRERMKKRDEGRKKKMNA